MAELTEILNLAENYLIDMHRVLLVIGIRAGFVQREDGVGGEAFLLAPKTPLVIASDNQYKTLYFNLIRRYFEFMDAFCQEVEQYFPDLARKLESNSGRLVMASNAITLDSSVDTLPSEPERRGILLAVEKENARKESLLHELYHRCLSLKKIIIEIEDAIGDLFEAIEEKLEAIEQRKQNIAQLAEAMINALNQLVCEQYRLQREYLLPLRLAFLTSAYLYSVPSFLVSQTASGLSLIATPLGIDVQSDSVSMACRHLPDDGAMLIRQPNDRPDYTLVLHYNAERQVIKTALDFDVRCINQLPPALQNHFNDYSENTLEGLLLQFKQALSRKERNAIKIKINALYERLKVDLTTFKDQPDKEKCAATLLTARAFIAKHTFFWRKEPSLAKLLGLCCFEWVRGIIKC